MVEDGDSHRKFAHTREFIASVKAGLIRAKSALKSIKEDVDLIHVSDAQSIQKLEETIARYNKLLNDADT